MKDKFIKYCADVMGWELKEGFCPDTYFANKKELGWMQINPYDDLNQTVEVVENIMHDKQTSKFYPLGILVYQIGIKQALRDFIISTMEKDNE